MGIFWLFWTHTTVFSTVFALREPGMIHTTVFYAVFALRELGLIHTT